jgi:crotonobetainyl-CoA:carnitine CoA-transferase CaiB-like acyl-CoA transferase
VEERNASQAESEGAVQESETKSHYGKRAGTGLIVVGYIFAALGGLIGLIIGALLAFGKERSSDGTKVPRYDAYSVKQGKIIFFLALGIILFWNILRFSMI